MGVVGFCPPKINLPVRQLGAGAGSSFTVTQKNYSGGLVLIYYCLDVQRGNRSAAGWHDRSRVYRDVFCRPWYWAILKASRRCSAWIAVSAFLFDARFLCRHRGLWSACSVAVSYWSSSDFVEHGADCRSGKSLYLGPLLRKETSNNDSTVSS